MIRRTYASPQPTLTRDRDEVAPACLGRPEPYDVLMDLTAGPTFHAARREALAMCARCPLVTECLSANRREPWARAIMGKTTPRPSQARPDTNQRKSTAAAKKWEAKRASRIEELRGLIDRGADLPEVLDMLGMTYAAFRKFGRKYAPDELAALTERTAA